MAEHAVPAAGRQRLDKWLFFSRAAKSRTLAQKLIEAGMVRVNSERTLESDTRVGPGDVLTITLGQRLLVWRVLDPGSRRGPAPEAAKLYEDLSPPPLPRDPSSLSGLRAPGAGRPTKKERRDIDALQADASNDADD